MTVTTHGFHAGKLPLHGGAEIALGDIRGDDRSLVSRNDPGSGVRADLEHVFRDNYSRVFGVARRVLGSPSEADDVAQDVFIAFARSQVPANEAPAWLTVAATHLSLNLIRSHHRRVDRDSRMTIHDSTVMPADPADEAIAASEHRRLREALRRLPHQQAAVLVLRHSGLSYAEIAQATDLSASSVGTTLRRAESALRKEMHDESPQ